MRNNALSSAFFVVSVVTAVLAVADALGVSVWLSANSWLIIAAVTGIWSLCTREK